MEDAFGFFLQLKALFLMTYSVLSMGILNSNTRFSNYKFIGITDTLLHLTVFFGVNWLVRNTGHRSTKVITGQLCILNKK